MSSVTQSGNKNSQDFELNLASIIDCFTVIIAFLLASTAFLSIGIFDAGIAAGAPQAQSLTPPSVQVAVEMKSNHRIEIKVSGKTTRNLSLDQAGEQWNRDDLVSRISEFKKEWPELQSVVLSADNDVAYHEVIKTMEKMKGQIQFVMLGGF